MTAGEPDLTDKGLSTFRRSVGTEKARIISAFVTPLEGVPLKG